MGIFDWSKTAGSNTSLESVTWSDSMAPNQIDDGVRAIAAAIKKWQEDTGGGIATGGSANAYTLTTNSTLPSYAAGQFFVARASFSNSGAATMAVDGLAALKLRKLSAGVDVALASGDYPSGHIGMIAYLAAGDSAAGALILLNPASSAGVALGDVSATGALSFVDWTTVSSATTTDIGAVASNFVLVSGTTTITGLGTVTAGAFRFLRFSGALVLTYNATSLILPGSANITTAAGDIAFVKSEGSGNWRCLDFSPASGLPLLRATAANYRVGTSTRPIGVDQAWGAMAEVTLTDAASITWDMSSGIDFTVTLGGNRTLSNPTVTTVGKKGRIRIVQDGTGSRTLAYGTNFKFTNHTAPTLTTTASTEDYLYYDCVSSTKIVCSLIRAVA
jgi:hypothetical protein